MPSHQWHLVRGILLPDRKLPHHVNFPMCVTTVILDWTSIIYSNKFQRKPPLNNKMKKFIPTIFAAVLAISSGSFLVGCSDGVTEDPEAKPAGDRMRQEQSDQEANGTAEEGDD